MIKDLEVKVATLERDKRLLLQKKQQLVGQFERVVASNDFVAQTLYLTRCKAFDADVEQINRRQENLLQEIERVRYLSEQEYNRGGNISHQRMNDRDYRDVPDYLGNQVRSFGSQKRGMIFLILFVCFAIFALVSYLAFDWQTGMTIGCIGSVVNLGLLIKYCASRSR